MSEEIIEKMAQAAYCDSYTKYGTATPERWKQTSETQRQFFRSQMRAVAAVLVAAGLLSACALKPAPQENAFCVLYQRLPDPSDAVHMKKRENKLAVLANEQSWLQFCGSNNSGLKGPI